MKNQKMTVRSYFQLVILTLMIIPFTGCAWGVSGNGKVITEERQLEKFSKIKVGEGIKLILIQGNETKALVETDENIMEILSTEVSGDVLRIRYKEKVRRIKRSKVTLTYTDLESLAVSSGAHASTEGVMKVDQLQLKTSSGGYANLVIDAHEIIGSTSSGAHIDLQGKTNSFNASASSGSHLEADELMAQTVNASASSGGKVAVYAAKSISAHASSGGNVSYKGSPEDVNVKTSSGGNIKKR